MKSEQERQADLERLRRAHYDTIARLERIASEITYLLGQDYLTAQDKKALSRARQEVEKIHQALKAE